MVDPAFSELQFAYGITREMEHGDWLWPPLGLPVLPTQVLEGEIGADVLFWGAGEDDVDVAPVVLQFKRSKLMTTGHATEWEDFGERYFRFSIYPENTSPQHNLLVELAKTVPLTCYVAPGFVHHHVYTGLHLARALARHSIFLECHRLDKVWADANHCVCYTMNPRRALWYSEPTIVDAIYGYEQFLEEARTHENEFKSVEETLHRLETAVRDVLDRTDIPPPDDPGRLFPVERLLILDYAFRTLFSASIGLLRRD